MSGGQVGDHGVISGATGKIVVDGTEKCPMANMCITALYGGTIDVGEAVTAQVDVATRQATARNHAATHLLHKALREVLGDHVHQAGSSVDAQRLRFDFSHMSAVTAEELARVEQKVNEVIYRRSLLPFLKPGLMKPKSWALPHCLGKNTAISCAVCKPAITAWNCAAVPM